MRVLVTGGTGFAGSHAVRALRAEGHDLRLLVRSPEKVARVFGEAPGEVVQGDVTDARSAADALEGVDGVVHAAAVVSMDAHRADEVLETNLRGVENVVGGAWERGARAIVYVSSLGALFAPGAGPITEDSPITDAESAYGRSKAQSERYVRGLQERGAPIRSVYPPGIVGPDDPGLSEANHAVCVFLRDLMADTSSGFEVIDVRDLAALIAALLRPEVPPGRYVAPGHYLPWPELIALMDALTGRRVRRIPISGSLLRASGRVGDWLKHLYPFDFPLSAEAMDLATQWPGTVPSPAIEKLGLRFHDGVDTYRDTIRWMVAAGHLTAKQAGKLGAPPR